MTTNVTNLDDERNIRRAPAHVDVIPSDIERQAVYFARGEGNAGRARRIARHPDLAARICAAYKLDTIGEWSGYLPPREWGGRYNDSDLRRAVVGACAEAFVRDDQHAWQENA